VLFLDELTEFRRNVLETLRQPLEEGRIVISRAKANCTYPAKFQLVAAMNPCPCGLFQGTCRCSPLQVKRYLSRISGPLLDRVALQVHVRAVDPRAWTRGRGPAPEGSDRMRERVMRAFEIQCERYRSLEGLRRNADLGASMLERFCVMEGEAARLLDDAQATLLFSARSRRNILQVARSIADLEGSGPITAAHIGEAVQYRVPKMLAPAI